MTRARVFEFHRGPIFANIVLADEINRASPKTQAALLEVMEEGAASVDGISHDVERRSWSSRRRTPSSRPEPIAAGGPARPVHHEDVHRVSRPRASTVHASEAKSRSPPADRHRRVLWR
jgi:hypothetical protein